MYYPDLTPYEFSPGEAVDAFSSAEIRVVGRDGRVYAAPTMISHYVEAHGYRPPEEFVAAVMQSVDAPTEPPHPPTGSQAEQVLKRQLLRERLRELNEKLCPELD